MTLTTQKDLRATAAIAAMQGFIGYYQYFRNKPLESSVEQHIVGMSVKYADALIMELEK